MTDAAQDQMQVRIAAARREAEGLKERIKGRKDTLADTSRECCLGAPEESGG